MNLSHDEAIKALKQIAKRLTKFHEGSGPTCQPGELVVGFKWKGHFGEGDIFFDAMRSLRKSPSRANAQAKSRKK